MATYTVISKLKKHGDQVEIPDTASNVTVQPVNQNGGVRITYLTPITELSIKTNQKAGKGQKYVD